MSCLHRVSLVRSDLRSCLRRSPLCPGPAPLVLGFHGQPSQASNALNAAAQASKALNAPAADVKLATSSSEQDPVRGRFVIPKEEVQASMRAQGLSLEEFLMSLIKPASREAKTPISGFHVGAVGLGGSGNVYVGVNVEFRKGPLNNSIHAEQFLLVNCLRSGETTVKALAVSEAPCGHCRQFMCELVCSDTMQLLFGKDMKPKSLAELLPLRFGPHDLVGDEPFPLLLQRQSHRVGYARRAQEELTVGSRAAEPLFQAAAARALKEAVGCYCPYTRSPAGAAIITASGQVFGGGYIESAAYNPSMSPLHTAFVDGVAQRGLDDLESQVVEVVLAERPGALVQHKAMAKALLKAVAPGAKLTVLPLQKLSAGASSSSSGSDAWAAAKTAAGAAGSSILYG